VAVGDRPGVGHAERAGGQARQEDMPVAAAEHEPDAALVAVAGTEVVGAVEDASGKVGLKTVHTNTLFRSLTLRPATFGRFWACFGVWNAVFELKEGGR
jgi:hypothetical protein